MDLIVRSSSSHYQSLLFFLQLTADYDDALVFNIVPAMKGKESLTAIPGKKGLELIIPWPIAVKPPFNDELKLATSKKLAIPHFYTTNFHMTAAFPRILSNLVPRVSLLTTPSLQGTGRRDTLGKRSDSFFSKGGRERAL